MYVVFSAVGLAAPGLNLIAKSSEHASLLHMEDSYDRIIAYHQALYSSGSTAVQKRNACLQRGRQRTFKREDHSCINHHLRLILPFQLDEGNKLLDREATWVNYKRMHLAFRPS